MKLFDFIRTETEYKIKNDVEYTGMTDSTRPKTLSFLDNPKFAGDLRNNKNIVTAFVRENKRHPFPIMLKLLLLKIQKQCFLSFTTHIAKCI